MGFFDKQSDDESKEQTSDDEIREAVGSTANGGDSEGKDVQSILTSPTGTPSYLDFLKDKNAPGAANVLGENVEMDEPGKTGGAAPAGAPPTSVSVSKEHKGARLSPLDPRGYQGPDIRDPMAMGAAAMGAVDRHEADRAAAAKQEADITEKYQARNAEILGAQHDEELYWAGVDERVAAHAAAEAHKYIAAYQSQMAAVRQMTVDPTGPIGSMNRWQAGAMTLGLFAQGVLATRGVHIDVQGQLDKWVDRSIHEQERRIQQAEAGAKDQLTMWELARQSSRDDAEAKQRYRGWVIAATQTAMQANAAGYQSELAQADANEKIAAFQQEADKTKYSIWANTYQLVHADRTLQETHRHNTVMESIDQEKEALKAQLAQAKAVKPAPTDVYVPDPEARKVIDPNTGRQTLQRVQDYKINPGLDKDVHAKVTEDVLKQTEEEARYQRQLKDLIDARKAVEDSKEWSLTARGERKIDATSAVWQHYQQARTEFLNSEIYKNSGKQINESEFKRFAAEVPDQAVFQKGSTDCLMRYMQDVGRANHQEWRDARVGANVFVPVDKSDPHHTVTIGGAAEPGLKATNEAIANPQAPVKTSIDRDVDIAESNKNDATARRASMAWKQLMGDDEQPLATTAVEDLVHAVVNPGRYRVENDWGGAIIPKDDQELNSQAVQALSRIAQEYNPSGSFARNFLHILKENPQEVKRLLQVDFGQGGAMSEPNE